MKVCLAHRPCRPTDAYSEVTYLQQRVTMRLKTACLIWRSLKHSIAAFVLLNNLIELIDWLTDSFMYRLRLVYSSVRSHFSSHCITYHDYRATACLHGSAWILNSWYRPTEYNHCYDIYSCLVTTYNTHPISFHDLTKSCSDDFSTVHGRRQDFCCVGAEPKAWGQNRACPWGTVSSYMGTCGGRAEGHRRTGQLFLGGWAIFARKMFDSARKKLPNWLAKLLCPTHPTE